MTRPTTFATLEIQNRYGQWQVTLQSGWNPDPGLYCHFSARCRSPDGEVEMSGIESKRTGATVADVAELSQAERNRYLAEVIWPKLRGEFEIESPEEEALPRVETIIQLLDDNAQTTVVFRADGKGFLMSPAGFVRCENRTDKVFAGVYPSRSFEHDIDVIAWLATPVEARTDLGEYFWEVVNEGFEYPYFQGEYDLEGSPLELDTGDEAAMTAVLQDLAWSEKAIWDKTDQDQITLAVVSNFGGENCGLDLEDYEMEDLELSDAFVRTADAIIGWFGPSGYTVEYNDGSRVDWSGYDKCAIRIPVTIERPTALQALEATERMMAWKAANTVNV